MSKRCKHENADHLKSGDPFAPHAENIGWCAALVEQFRCLDCGAWLSLGPSNDEPEAVRVEIRAAEIAADAREGVGLGGHRPDHNDGQHCWHFYDDDADDECCYCRREYSIDNSTWCQTALLALTLATHDAASDGGEG